MTGTLPGLDTHLLERVRTPMRDGAHLAGILYRDAAGPRPVMLVRTPYAEPLSRSLPVLPALDAGFAVLVQDCRGTGRSDGELRTFENETADGLDTLGWLTRQPWCDGRIVMYGMSYLGMVQLAVSGHRPGGLVAIAPTVTPDDYRDGLVYRQGAFQLGQALAWHLLTAAQLLPRNAGRDGVAAALAGLAADPESAYRALPLSDRPGLTDILPGWRTWLGRENDRKYWQGISYASRRAGTAVPALHVGGWFDLFLRGTLGNYTTMAPAGGQHLIVGPWSHADQSGITGEVYHPGGSAQAIRLEHQQLRFLRESADGAPASLPPVQVYVMGAGRWRTENEWPPARTDRQTWYLGADGSLGRDLPGAGTAEYVHDPRDPVPTVGGAILMAGSRDGGLGYQPGSRDQRLLDARTDILRFTGPVLDHDVEVTGPLTVHLHAATSAADTDFTAKLVDVHPGGRAMGIADGIVRARYRSGMDTPLPVVPGKVYEYRIDVGATSQLFRAGHRIRVDIASSNFPCFDRNPGTGTPAGQVTEDEFVPATQCVHFGPEHPSSIRLPVIPADKGDQQC
ncbi:CocE/NonD family hydrolase [Amycolatopsis acidiphila]|uniref:CocE/NonD family hydrolase n=1 Tax=Amycolatopsis acidiphila TaxID=715473 RepID=A0A558AG92_9PSEU|nr:CocE/NonD family hydrolase [Amycolatopsis acidiphila]TVT23246.1 CocE/NonD family hydrolase [Amycolatopsis acidiphila]UIJ63735.1 CocE/NonD family hydrolase [Amycolatopsis acidiphila]GHG67119.1 X-Pro dipeptidyl-peptidase [Amycolatopsis acidiphila]